MDKETAKLVLESYRPTDADDPTFEEALREAAADPELSAWFEEVQRFDAVVRATLKEIPVPPDLKGHLLLGRYNVVTTPAFQRSRVLAWVGSIAAVLVLGVAFWRWAPTREKPGDALALQAIAHAERMPALQFVCFDAAVVANWVNEQPDAQRLGITLPDPGKSLSMEMIGSSIVHWNGRPVVMICLQNDRRMAMLYILGPNDAADMKEGATETMQKAGWVVRTSKAAGRVRILATKGQPEDLNFPMPF